MSEPMLMVMMVCGTIVGITLILATVHLIVQTDKAKG